VDDQIRRWFQSSHSPNLQETISSEAAKPDGLRVAVEIIGMGLDPAPPQTTASDACSMAVSLSVRNLGCIQRRGQSCLFLDIV
jgi:hypothetical protein